MASAQATIVITARERFSLAVESLENVLRQTRGPFELIYVDGNSPPAVQAQLQAHASRHPFQLIRDDRYLCPQAARNLALPYVKTPYVVFIDNDVFVEPDWLVRLVECAEETGAWAVGPIYCQGQPLASEIHMAGGISRFVYPDGRRIYREKHLLYGEPLASRRHLLTRSDTELLEMHTLLVSMQALEHLGPLDEGYLSQFEHVDLCMAIREAGERVVLEPNAVVTYVGPLPLAKTDLPYFELRWSEGWNQISREHFCDKWNVPLDDAAVLASHEWCNLHRRKRIAWWPSVRTWLKPRRQKRFEKQVLIPWEAAANRRKYPIAECRPGGMWDGGVCLKPRWLLQQPPLALAQAG